MLSIVVGVCRNRCANKPAVAQAEVVMFRELLETQKRMITQPKASGWAPRTRKETREDYISTCYRIMKVSPDILENKPQGGED